MMSSGASTSASASASCGGGGSDDPNNDNPQAGQNRPLPKKESDLFKNVVKFYESKQYKKGLKNADAVLKRFPNHGETLCMKGLIVNAMASALWGGETTGSVSIGGGKEPVVDKKKEAVELVKRGLMMDMRCVLLATLLHHHHGIQANAFIHRCHQYHFLLRLHLSPFPLSSDPSHMVIHKLTNHHL